MELKGRQIALWLVIVLGVVVVAPLRTWLVEPERREEAPPVAEEPAQASVVAELVEPSTPAIERALAPTALAHDEQPAASGTSIRGIVIERSGAPVAGAECELRLGLPSSPIAGSEPPLPAPIHASTRTGADGSFELPAGPGSWRLTVRSPGFTDWERDHLAAGDELDVRLDPEVHLFVSVSGPAGEPVTDAEVTVLPRTDELAPPRSRARTAADGRAVVPTLAPGAWLLIVRRPGYGVFEEPLAVPVGVFTLERDVRLERASRLVGTVRSSTGAGVAGARVQIESPNRNAALVVEVVADADGRYTTEPLFTVRETLEIVASAESFAESWLFYAIPPEQAGGGDVTLDFLLGDTARTVAGRVVDDGRGVGAASIRIATLDPVGTSPEDVLMAKQSAPARAWLWQEVARTDDDGRFELTGLAAGPQYVVLVVRDGYAPRVAWAPPAEAGTRTDLGELELDRPGSLFGRALYADGAPAEGVELLLFPVVRVYVSQRSDLGAWRPSSWFAALRVRTGEGGSFRFDLLAPGPYQILDTRDEWAVESGRATGPVEVMLPRKEPLAEVEVTGSVQGRAGEPLPSVFVRALAADGTAGARLLSAALVDARGRFALRVPSTGGAWLHFADLEGVHVEQGLALDSPLPRDPLVVVLEERAVPLPPLEGSVLSRKGPVEACRVALRPPEDSLCGCLTFHAQTDAAGEFRFEHVNEGPHRLSASHPLYATGTFFPARPGEYAVIDLPER